MNLRFVVVSIAIVGIALLSTLGCIPEPEPEPQVVEAPEIPKLSPDLGKSGDIYVDDASEFDEYIPPGDLFVPDDLEGATTLELISEPIEVVDEPIVEEEPEIEFKLKPVANPEKATVNAPPAYMWTMTESMQAVKVTMWADGKNNRMYFYDEGEEVGCLRWEDVTGDGELELTWTGISVQASAEVLMRFMKQSGKFCECP